MGSDTGYILEMNHITKEFPGVKALKDVTFKVRKGGDCLKTRIVERSAAIRLPHPQWGV